MRSPIKLITDNYKCDSVNLSQRHVDPLRGYKKMLIDIKIQRYLMKSTITEIYELTKVNGINFLEDYISKIKLV